MSATLFTNSAYAFVANSILRRPLSSSPLLESLRPARRCRTFRLAARASSSSPSASPPETRSSYSQRRREKKERDAIQQQDEQLSRQQSVSFADHESVSGYKSPTVSWYPGHIAKAERLLAETLKSADVLVEVRDGRIPQSTSHPKIVEWTATRPRIVVMTKLDLVPKRSVASWKRWWERMLETVHEDKDPAAKAGKEDRALWVDGRRGQGVPGLHRAIARSGKSVNERRRRRGLRDRPLRVAVLGYPNVGKSALINRILGRRRAKSADTPGITRALQWIRVGGSGAGSGGAYGSVMTDETGRSKRSVGSGGGSDGRGASGDYELLDSPGIIPASMENQEDALLLACCNCIGNAAYDNQGVAAYLCERLKTLYEMDQSDLTCPQWRQKSIERYRFDPLKPVPIVNLSRQGTAMTADQYNSDNYNNNNDNNKEENLETRMPTGEDMLFQVAYNTCKGDLESAARKILQDFRQGRMGPMALQVAPSPVSSSLEEEEGNQMSVDVRRNVAILGETPRSVEEVAAEDQARRDEKVNVAVRKVKDRGLDLPPQVVEAALETDNDENQEEDIGKGLFDGW